MKVVWHASGLIEREWFLYLLGDVVDGEIIDLDLTCFDDDTIHVVNTNWRQLSGYNPYFRQLRARNKRIILYHVADEWFSGGYASYRYFDLVIRWNHTYLIDSPGIVTIPFGYPNGTGTSARPVDQRQFAWSFVGEIKSSRIAMARALDGFQPHFLTGTDSLAKANPKRLSKPEYDAILENSVFVPCPMGNATMEASRLYESLEFGCIPLLELRVSLDYHGNLFGPNPLPAFRTWPQARRYAETLYADKAALLAKQTEIRQWWLAYKAETRRRVREIITGPSHSADLWRYANKLRNRYVAIHEPLRAVEILRHQTAGSLMRRLARPVGPLKRVLADLSGGKLATPTAISRQRNKNQNTG